MTLNRLGRADNTSCVEYRTIRAQKGRVAGENILTRQQCVFCTLRDISRD